MVATYRLITLPKEIDDQIKESAIAHSTSVSAFLRESAIERIEQFGQDSISIPVY